MTKFDSSKQSRGVKSLQAVLSLDHSFWHSREQEHGIFNYTTRRRHSSEISVLHLQILVLLNRLDPNPLAKLSRNRQNRNPARKEIQRDQVALINFSAALARIGSHLHLVIVQQTHPCASEALHEITEMALPLLIVLRHPHVDLEPLLRNNVEKPSHRLRFPILRHIVLLFHHDPPPPIVLLLVQLEHIKYSSTLDSHWDR